MVRKFSIDVRYHTLSRAFDGHAHPGSFIGFNIGYRTFDGLLGLRETTDQLVIKIIRKSCCSSFFHVLVLILSI